MNIILISKRRENIYGAHHEVNERQEGHQHQILVVEERIGIMFSPYFRLTW